jgi:uncharacterized phage protein (TIGR01671 family)|nr:MAG TPA: YopX protein [Caudoviricetes sp.]
MREILFKAKRKDNGKWIEGYYQKRYDLLGNEEHLIFHADSYNVWEYAEIDPETVCQFTGLCDKNGKKIWENDILRFTQQDETKIGVIKYNAPIFTYFGLMRWSLYKDEVIGNIFDNPELLQEESDE